MSESSKPEIPALRRHYGITQIARAWGMNPCLVRKIFAAERGVIRGTGTEKIHLRVPEDVLDRVYRERLTR